MQWHVLFEPQYLRPLGQSEMMKENFLSDIFYGYNFQL